MTDPELLREFVKNGSEAAFATLVQRHIDFVYSVALRIVADRQLAEDVTQAVFVAVARGAGELEECSVLSGWLHRTARNQAVMTVRSEVRRRARENDMATMNANTTDPVPEWDRLAPALDAALDALRPTDRDALLLRYFEKKTAREIGERLGVTEEAAQKRVTRSLEKLRETFHQRGVSVTGTGLVAAFSLQAAQAAPAGLAATVVSVSIGSAATAIISAPSILTFMLSTKTKLLIASLVMAGLATSLVVQYQTNVRLREELAAQAARAGASAATETKLVDPELAQAELIRLRAEHSDLMRLRAEVALLRQKDLDRTLALMKAGQPAGKVAEIATGGQFITSDRWSDVGADTPGHAFQSFLTSLKSGDPAQFSSRVQWEVKWKDDVTEEDRKLVEKSMQDYVEMMQRASKKISAFNLAPVTDSGADRTRVHFQVLTPEGEAVNSSFEMQRTDGQWKPVLSMRWMDPKNDQSFATSPLFGPKIDFDRPAGTP